MAASTPLNINQQDEPDAPLDQPILCSNCMTTDIRSSVSSIQVFNNTLIAISKVAN